MDITGTINTILAICGGISIIGGAAAIVWKLILPAVKMKGRVEQLERNAKKNYEAIEEVRTMQAGMCQALIAIMDHQITGNHVDGLKKTKSDLIKMITEN